MNKRCEFIKVTNEQEQKIDEIRAFFSMMFDKIDTLCLSSRETSLAITKLEEAQFWAIKGISRESQGGELNE